jgi:hypothetical protein
MAFLPPDEHSSSAAPFNSKGGETGRFNNPSAYVSAEISSASLRSGYPGALWLCLSRFSPEAIIAFKAHFSPAFVTSRAVWTLPAQAAEEPGG